MQRAGSQAVCHSCDSYVREMTLCEGKETFGSQGSELSGCIGPAASFQVWWQLRSWHFWCACCFFCKNRFSLTLLPVFLIRMRLYRFFPFQTSQAGLEPVIVLSVEYLLLEAFTRSQLTLASWAQNAQLLIAGWDRFEKLLWALTKSYKIYFSSTLLQLWIENYFYIKIWHKVHDAFL